MIKRLAQSALAPLAMAFAVPAAAQGQVDFNCHRLLHETGFMGSTEADATLVLEMRKISYVPDDPVSVREIPEGREKPFLLTHRPRYRDKLGCQLIVVQFHAKTEEGSIELLKVSDHGGDRIPILLVRSFESPEGAEKNAESWAENNFNISAYFKDEIHNENPDNFVADLKSERLSESRYLGLSRNQAGHSRVLEFTKAQDKVVQKLFDDAGVANDPPIFVLCHVKCEYIKRFVSDPSETENSAASPNTLPQWSELNNYNGDATDGEATNSGRPNTWMTRILVPYERDYKNVGPLGIDRLECILVALGADIFLNPESCEENSAAAMKRLKELNARIRVSDNGDWIIEEGAAIEMPTHVALAIPAGFNSRDCEFNLIYTDDDGIEKELKLDKYRNENETGGPPVIRAQVTRPFQIDQGQVSATLVNVNEAGNCPFIQQEVTLPAQAELTIPLDVGNSRRDGLTHIFLLHGDNLQKVLGLESDDAVDLARKSVDAVQAAHYRVSHTNPPPEEWALVNATVGAVTGRGEFKTWFTLDASLLRYGVSSAFGNASNFRIELIDNSLALDASDLEKAIFPLQDKATKAGLTALTITLISYVQPDTSEQKVDPCDGGPFADAVARLNDRPDEVPVTFKVFSIVRHSPSKWSLDTRRLRPRGFSPSALAEGGAYKCVGGDPAVTIYPFIIEPWRDSVDVAARYATALSDQLVLIIEDAISGFGVN